MKKLLALLLVFVIAFSCIDGMFVTVNAITDYMTRQTGDVIDHLRGDSNSNGELDILDVTTIQRVLAEHSVWTYDEIAADADMDGIVDIIDAVLLYRILAVMTTFERWDHRHMLANTGIAHESLRETNSSDKSICSVGDSQTAIITIYGFNGQSETKLFNVGDTFDVYTYLNASDLADGGKIAAIDASQIYTDSILSLNETTYPIFGDSITHIHNTDQTGKILYNALTPEVDYPFILNSDDDAMIQTTYTVTAPGEGEVRNAIKTLAAADEDITPIIKNGAIVNNGVINVEAGFDKREHIHTPSSAVIENDTPSTCSVKGSYDEVIYCADCKEEISRETKYHELAAHLPGEPLIENDTTSCLKSGTYDVVEYCPECGQEISRETKIADPLGHHLVFVKPVNATYSRNGRYAHYECDRCGKLFADATGAHEITEDILVIPMLVEETWAPVSTEPETEPPTEPDPIESSYGDYTYKLYNDGHIEITKYNGNDKTVSVPSEIDGHPVTLIGEKAFYGNTALTEVTIPNSVKSIGNTAFSHCSALETVSLPDSIKYLNYGLFSYCTSLKNVMIPASVTNIGYNAFYHCFSLTDISIPESVTSINSQAFDWCPSLKQVNIPSTVKSIGSKAFGYVCDKKSDGFKILGYENSAAHRYAKANGFDFESTGYIFVPPTEPQPTSPYPDPTEASTEPATEPTPGQIGDKTYNLNTYNKTATLQKYSGKSSSVSIPSQEYIYHYYYSDSGYYNVTAIGNTAFAGNSYVRSVTIPNSVTSIGDDAFFRCDSLSSVTIPNSVTSIGCCAFAQCDLLKNVTISSSVTSIGDKAFGYIDANTKVDGFTVTGRTGSAAHKYAIKNGFTFVANDSNILGDVDSDYEVTVMDATFIQAYLSYRYSLNGGEYEPVEIGSRDFTVADVDGDGRISIFDALRIQRYCAKMCKLDGSPYDD